MVITAIFIIICFATDKKDMTVTWSKHQFQVIWSRNASTVAAAATISTTKQQQQKQHQQQHQQQQHQQQQQQRTGRRPDRGWWCWQRCGVGGRGDAVAETSTSPKWPRMLRNIILKKDFASVVNIHHCRRNFNSVLHRFCWIFSNDFLHSNKKCRIFP